MEDPTHLSLCFSLPPLDSQSVIGRGKVERMEGGKEGRKEDREGQTGSEGERKRERTGGENIRLEQASFTSV